jgi:hypothetical protein
MHIISLLPTNAFKCMHNSVIQFILTICSSVCNVLPYKTNSRCVYVCRHRLTASRHSYANCMVQLLEDWARIAMQVCTFDPVITQNLLLACVYKLSPQLSRRGVISPKFQSRLTVMRAYIPVTETRQIIDV